MNTIFRSIIGIAGGAAVTLAIFLSINAFLPPDPILYKNPEEPEKIYLLNRIICECGNNIIVDNIVQPIPTDASNQWTDNDKAAENPPQLDTQKPSTAIEFELYTPAAASSTGHPTSSMPYPTECLEKSKQGEVFVQFDITPFGDTENIEIISSPDDCFNQPVIDWLDHRALNTNRPMTQNFQWSRRLCESETRSVERVPLFRPAL